MGFQSTVTTPQGFGVVGELFLDGPIRAQPMTLVSDDAAYNVVGRAFTTVSQGVAKAGGTGVFAGILANPKVYASNGTANGGSLAPTLTLPNYTVAELVQMGSIIVSLAAAANIGDWVYFHNTTGVLATTAPGEETPADHTRIYGAEVDRYTVGSGGSLAVITLGTPNTVLIS